MSDTPKRGKAPGSGRKPGTPNKVTKELQEMILAALDTAGGEEYLARQANENPNAFLSLLGRVIPLKLKGAGGMPLRIEVITGVPEPQESNADLLG